MNLLNEITIFLPRIISFLTGKPRYKPEIVWSSKSWVHNIFRFYELIFWRRFGIRPELTSGVYYENGKKKVYYIFHSVEAFLAHTESVIRGIVPKFIPEKVWLSSFATPQGFSFPSQFLFAIALDSANNGGTTASAASLTWSHTCTGSDLILFAGAYWEATTNTITSVTYNSVAMTNVNTVINFNSNGNSNGLWYLTGPNTGANNLTVNTSPDQVMKGASTSYTGAKQTGQPDAQNTGTGIAVTTLTTSVTTVADNCWLVGWTWAPGGSAAAGANTTLRGGPANAHKMYDSNAAQTPPGSYGQTITQGSNDITMMIASFAPAVAAGFGGRMLRGFG